MSSEFFQLVQQIKAAGTIPQKINAIVSALEQLEQTAAPFCRVKEQFVRPSPSSSVEIKVTNTAWMLVGMKVVDGSGQAAGYFIVTEVVDDETVVLMRFAADAAEAAVAVIDAGSIVTPGVPSYELAIAGKADLDQTTRRLKIQQLPSIVRVISATEEAQILAGNYEQGIVTLYYYYDTPPTSGNRLYTLKATSGAGREIYHNFKVNERIQINLSGYRSGIIQAIALNRDIVVLLDAAVTQPATPPPPAVAMAVPVRYPVNLASWGLVDGMVVIAMGDSIPVTINSYVMGTFNVGGGHPFQVGDEVIVEMSAGVPVEATVIGITATEVILRNDALQIPAPTNLEENWPQAVPGSPYPNIQFMWEIPLSHQSNNIVRSELEIFWPDYDITQTGSSYTAAGGVSIIGPHSFAVGEFIDIIRSDGSERLAKVTGITANSVHWIYISQQV